MHCHACNALTEMLPGSRIGFQEECEGCGSDLHTCRNCAHYDPGAYNDCRESSADRVSDRERGNRCEYFRPGDRDGESGEARGQVLEASEALFKKP